MSKASIDRYANFLAMSIAKKKSDLISQYISERKEIEVATKSQFAMNNYNYGDKYATDDQKAQYDNLVAHVRELESQIVGKSGLTILKIQSKYKLLKSDPKKFDEIYTKLQSQVEDDRSKGEKQTIGRIPQVGTKFTHTAKPENEYEIVLIKDDVVTYRKVGAEVTYEVPAGTFQNARKSGKVKIMESIMEATRSELVGKARSDDKRRYNDRLSYRPVTFDGVNIKELFESDDLVFTTKVGSYTNIVAVKGMLTAIKSIIRGKNKCTYADVLKAINRCLDKDGLRMNCDCADFTYRYKYWAYKGGYLYGDPGKAAEPPKYDRTNKDGRGSMCKHLASLLTNKIWIVKVAAAVNNYIRLNKKSCYPYLDLEVPKDKPVQADKVPTDDAATKEVDEPVVDDTQVDQSTDEFDDTDVGSIADDDTEPQEDEEV